MAVIDDVQEQWKKEKDKPLKQRIGYFIHYYLIIVIVIVAIVAFVTYFIHNFATKKPIAYTAAFINADTSVEDTLASEIAKQAGIDTDKEDIDLNMNRKLTPGGLLTQQDLGTQTALSAQMMDASLDAVVSDAWNFYYYVELASFQDLRDVLTDEELDKYKGDLYYVDLTEIKKVQKEMNSESYDGSATEEDRSKAIKDESYENFVKPDPSKMDDPVPVGIILSDSSFIKKNKLYQSSVPVFGFVNNSKHVKTSKILLRILTE